MIRRLPRRLAEYRLANGRPVGRILRTTSRDVIVDVDQRLWEAVGDEAEMLAATLPSLFDGPTGVLRSADAWTRACRDARRVLTAVLPSRFARVDELLGALESGESVMLPCQRCGQMAADAVRAFVGIRPRIHYKGNHPVLTLKGGER